MESGRGPTANVLVQNGTLRLGDYLLCGTCYGKVKALLDYQGKTVKRALPSTPIMILGLSGVPEAGEHITICANEREAREKAAEAAEILKNESLAVVRKTSLEDIFATIEEDEKPEMLIVLKTDVRGSLEAIIENINKIKHDKITVRHSRRVGKSPKTTGSKRRLKAIVINSFHCSVMPGINRLAKQRALTYGCTRHL